MTPPHLVGFANGVAQSIVSLARFAGPILGGTVSCLFFSSSVTVRLIAPSPSLALSPFPRIPSLVPIPYPSDPTCRGPRLHPIGSRALPSPAPRSVSSLFPHPRTCVRSHGSCGPRASRTTHRATRSASPSARARAAPPSSTASSSAERWALRVGRRASIPSPSRARARGAGHCRESRLRQTAPTFRRSGPRLA